MNANDSNQQAALELIQQTRLQLSHLMDQITTHRFLDALEARQIPLSALQTFATQQYHIVTSGIRNIALLVHRYGQLPNRTILNDFLQAEFVVRERIPAFAEAVGVFREQLPHSPKLAKAMMFSYFIAYVCLYGCDADLILAFRFDSEVWIQNSLRMYRALRSKYGLTSEQAEFFKIYQNYREADERVSPYIQAALERGESATQMQETARLLLEYELNFWDAMAETANT
jgi:thiaminase